MSEFTIHPLALKFPELPPKEFEELKESIATIGLLDPVVINSNSQILDGRHRYKACKELGIEPHTVLWTNISRYAKSGITEAEFIFAANFHRRHLSDDQRLQVVAAFLPHIKQETAAAKAEGQAAGGKEHGKSSDTKSSPSKRDLKGKHAKSAQGKLAEKAETTEYKAGQAIEIEKVPDLAEKVRSGELTRPEAIKIIDEREALENGVQTTLPFNGSTEPEKGPELLTPEKLTEKVSKWCETHLGKLLNSIHQDQLELALGMVISECNTTINECKAAREPKEEPARESESNTYAVHETEAPSAETRYYDYKLTKP